jgi:hypothetical protein
MLTLFRNVSKPRRKSLANSQKQTKDPSDCPPADKAQLKAQIAALNNLMEHRQQKKQQQEPKWPSAKNTKWQAGTLL